MLRRRVNPTVDIFRSMPLFDGLRRRDLEAIAHGADEVHLPAGFALLTQGELPQDFFVLVQGSADVLVGDHRLGSAGDGTVLGLSSALGPHRRRASVVSTTPVRVLAFGLGEVRRFTGNDRLSARLRTEPALLPECLYGEVVPQRVASVPAQTRRVVLHA